MIMIRVRKFIYCLPVIDFAIAPSHPWTVARMEWTNKIGLTMARIASSTNERPAGKEDEGKVT
jgi:hypothetical protein